jgi:hypothetical protein
MAIASGQGTEPSIRYGVTKSRDTVTVGEPFEVRVRIRVPADAQIAFPDNPDTVGTIQARDPRTIETADSVQSLDETAIYRLAAWDTDSQSVRLADAVVTWNGVEKRVPIGEIGIFVRSVLPADSAQRVPKPARPIWETRPFPWWLLLVVDASARSSAPGDRRRSLRARAEGAQAHRGDGAGRCGGADAVRRAAGRSPPGLPGRALSTGHARSHES